MDKNYIAYHALKTIVMSLWNLYETIEKVLTCELITEHYCFLLKMALCVGPAAAEGGRTRTGTPPTPGLWFNITMSS